MDRGGYSGGYLDAGARRPAQLDMRLCALAGNSATDCLANARATPDWRGLCPANVRCNLHAWHVASRSGRNSRASRGFGALWRNLLDSSASATPSRRSHHSRAIAEDRSEPGRWRRARSTRELPIRGARRALAARRSRARARARRRLRGWWPRACGGCSQLRSGTLLWLCGIFAARRALCTSHHRFLSLTCLVRPVGAWWPACD